MTDEKTLAAWCNAMSALLDLPIERANRAEIIANLRIIFRQMEFVDKVSLDDFAEPAPVFHA